MVQGTQLISKTDNVGFIIDSIERIQKCGNVEQVVSFEISSSKEQIEYGKLRYLAIKFWIVE